MAQVRALVIGSGAEVVVEGQPASIAEMMVS